MGALTVPTCARSLGGTHPGDLGLPLKGAARIHHRHDLVGVSYARPMEFYDRERLAELLTWPAMIAGIAEMLDESAAVSPPRHVHAVSAPGTDDDVLLLMPSWISGSLIGIKAVTFFGSNTARGLPNVNAAYMVFDGETGVPIAVMDGEELTSRRTMAASALASSYLSRPDAASLLVVGTGQLARFAVEAHCSVRPIENVRVWGRNPDKATSVVESFGAMSVEFAIETIDDLDRAVAEADVISCVTSAAEPLIRGALLRPGTHLDLVGSFKEDMRESDDDCVRRATVFVDTRDGALLSGDLAQPIAAGVLAEQQIVADLAALVSGAHRGRADADEITLFKSAGFALEDLAAARVALGR